MAFKYFMSTAHFLLISTYSRHCYHQYHHHGDDHHDHDHDVDDHHDHRQLGFEDDIDNGSELP